MPVLLLGLCHSRKFLRVVLRGLRLFGTGADLLLLIGHRLGSGVGLNRLFEVLWVTLLMVLAAGCLEPLRLRECEPLVEGAQGRDEREPYDDAPCAVDLAGMACFHRILIAEENDHGHDCAHERAPALVGEDVGEEGAPPAGVRALRHDRGGQGVVAAHADTEYDTPDCEPEKGTARGEVT